MQRIVHLDCKGAPLKVAYLKQVLVSIKQWGATGVLMEWEDTFPFTGELVDVGSQRTSHGSGGDGMYSREEVHHVFAFAQELGLEVIQLVQTMGHMEYVLKHPQFRSLREIVRSSAVLCPLKDHSQSLVRTMVTQVLDAQPGARFIHIGADEVWHLGTCEQCKAKAATSRYGASTLFLEHISSLVHFIRQLRPGIAVLMWDDMIRNFGTDALSDYKLNRLVEPVTWHYNPKACFSIDPTLWLAYGQMFPRVWAASAFKGANGSSAQIIQYVEMKRYTDNHEAWREEIQKSCTLANFGGIILTGWSRYDHYATLCELLPVALPTLRICLKILQTPIHVPADASLCDEPQSSEFPGLEAAKALTAAAAVKEKAYQFLHGQQVTSWFSAWHQRNKYYCPDQLQSIANTAHHLITELTITDTELIAQLHTITGRRSTMELTETHLRPLIRQLTELRDKAMIGSSMEPGVLPVQ